MILAASPYRHPGNLMPMSYSDHSLSPNFGKLHYSDN